MPSEHLTNSSLGQLQLGSDVINSRPTPRLRQRPARKLTAINFLAMAALEATAASFSLVGHTPLSPLRYFDYSKPPVGSREEFRTPSGVGKSPRNEPAVCRARLMGI
jgi:hypothetical protein